MPHGRGYDLPIGRPLAIRVAVLLSLGIVGGLGLACGETDQVAPDPASEALERAAGTSAGFGARIEFTAAVTENGNKTALSGTGEIEAGGRRDRMVASVSGTRVEMFTDGPYTLFAAEVLGVPAEQLPSGVQWLKVDMRKLGDVAGLSGSRLQALQNTHPAGMVERMRPYARAVRRVGEETVRGVKTIHYEMKLSAGDLLKLLTEGVENPPKPSDEVADAEIPFDVWVDADDIVRKSRLRYHGGGTAVDLTTEVTELDRDLRIDVPSGDSVLDVTDEVAEEGRRQRGG